MSVGAQEALAHLFACELEQWFTAHSTLGKIKKDASTDKRLRKRSRKKCDRAITEEGIVIITGAVKIGDAVWSISLSARVIVGAATSISGAERLMIEPDWIICRPAPAIIESVGLIGAVAYLMSDAVASISDPAPVIIACGGIGNEADCAVSGTVRKRYLSALKIFNPCRKICQRSKKTKQC